MAVDKVTGKKLQKKVTILARKKPQGKKSQLGFVSNMFGMHESIVEDF